MKQLCIALALGLIASALWADHPLGKGEVKPVGLLPGLGNHHHPVATTSKEAQRWFDQGLLLLYAFNHEAAVRSFVKAAEHDPQLAMAWWGVAVGLGSNYNLEADAEQLKEAFAALEKAKKLAAKAPEQERAYIEALAKRYSADPKADRKKLAVDYKNAMGELARRYPDDLDAATLHAESWMNLRPWELWGHDGKPAEGTEEILATLEGVLKRNPDHPGANHYYIHAVEASPNPERGLASAERLKTLVPGAGHLVHMPSHIYWRVGDYEQAAKQNEIAMMVDGDYLKASGAKGVYPLMYYSHNIHFLAVARAMQGRPADAQQAAEKLAGHVGPHVKDMPMLEGFMPTPYLVAVRCGRWQHILKMPAPDSKQHITTAIWHFARGSAFANTGRPKEAEQERQAFLAVSKKVPADAAYGDRNKAHSVLAIAEHLLEARVALANKDRKSAIEKLRQAVKCEDALNYIEPPDWYIPARELLGAVLIHDGQPAAAEAVFRTALEKHPRNGRALFGLRASLQAQQKDYAARLVDQEFAAAWKHADQTLDLKDY